MQMAILQDQQELQGMHSEKALIVQFPQYQQSIVSVLVIYIMPSPRK